MLRDSTVDPSLLRRKSAPLRAAPEPPASAPGQVPAAWRRKAARSARATGHPQ